MMHRRLFVARLGLGLGSLIAGGTVHAAQTVKVVTSFSLLGDMVRRIGGGMVSVQSLVPDDGDAHTYQPRPSDMRGVTGAAVLVENGLGFEGWMDRLTGATRFAGARVVATKGIKPRTMRQGGGIVSVDPHAWQDPRNGVVYARNIQAGLIAAAPDHMHALTDAADRYALAIAQADSWIEQQFAGIPPERRRVITTHDAFGYYGDRYGIEFLAAQGINTDAEPSARAVAGLIAQIRKENIGAVFIENMTDGRMAKMLARETGAVVGGTVYSDALSPPNGPAASYLAMLRHNTTLFARAMRGGKLG